MTSLIYHEKKKEHALMTRKVVDLIEFYYETIFFT